MSENHGAIYAEVNGEVVRLDSLLIWSDMSEIRAYEELDEPLENTQPLSVVVEEAGLAIRITPELATQMWELAINTTI